MCRCGVRITEIGEGNGSAGGMRKAGVRIGDLKGVASLVVPGLEVRRFGRPDAEKNAKDFSIGHALRERRIETAASLFDKAKVETSREGDGLSVNAHAARLTGI